MINALHELHCFQTFVFCSTITCMHISCSLATNSYGLPTCMLSHDVTWLRILVVKHFWKENPARRIALDSKHHPYIWNYVFLFVSDTYGIWHSTVKSQLVLSMHFSNKRSIVQRSREIQEIIGLSCVWEKKFLPRNSSLPQDLYTLPFRFCCCHFLYLLTIFTEKSVLCSFVNNDSQRRDNIRYK